MIKSDFRNNISKVEIFAKNSIFRPAFPLKILHLNTRSIRNKEQQLSDLYASITHRFDILMYTETWLTETEKPPHFHGYSYNGFVRSSGRGGGIAIYVKTSLRHAIISECSVINSSVECMSVYLQKLIVVVIYRPPMGNKIDFFEYLERMLSFLCRFSMPFVIMGDVNIDMLSSNTAAKKFIEMIHSFACTNLITEATRLTEKSATSLDICVTNIHSRDCFSGLLTADVSDHLPIFCLLPNMQVKRETTVEALSRSISAAGLEVFRSNIQSIDWTCVFEKRNPNAAYEAFFEKLGLCYNQAFPMTLRKLKPKRARKPWIDEKLLKMIKTKNKMYHTFVRSRNLEALSEFKKYRNRLNTGISVRGKHIMKSYLRK